MKMKYNVTQLKNALEILEKGPIAASKWTSGTGRFISKRPIPPFCLQTKASLVTDAPEMFPLKVRRFVKKNPKVKLVIFCNDVRGLKAAYKKKAE